MCQFNWVINYPIFKLAILEKQKVWKVKLEYLWQLQRAKLHGKVVEKVQDLRLSHNVLPIPAPVVLMRSYGDIVLRARHEWSFMNLHASIKATGVVKKIFKSEIPVGICQHVFLPAKRRTTSIRPWCHEYPSRRALRRQGGSWQSAGIEWHCPGWTVAGLPSTAADYIPVDAELQKIQKSIKFRHDNKPL